MVRESSPTARNYKAKSIVAGYIVDARKKPLLADEKLQLRRELAVLKQLIPIKANGFRGVVLTVIVGKILDSQFRPLEDFYGCNPRPLFEQGIYYALQEARIPSGKSDPLNVAKNIQKLNDDWARGKRPEEAAKAAVRYIEEIEKNWENKEKRELLIRAYFEVLVEYADFINQQIAPLTPLENIIPIDIANRLANFAVECPEGGIIPQYIVGNLIKLMRSEDARYSSVEGVDESVFGTNTTSKKPADIWEIKADGNYGILYEVTVKKIDFKRLDDCVDALRKSNIAARLITFICNLPFDIEPLQCNENYLIYQGVGFQFLDIQDFILDIYCALDSPLQSLFMDQLKQFVSEPNRALKTKSYWSQVFVSDQKL